MRRLIIAGIGQHAYKVKKAFSPVFSAWDTLVIPSRSRKPNLRSCWPEVLSVADATDPEGCHILAFHPVEREYPEFRATAKYRHRLVWGDRLIVSKWGTTEFTSYLNAIFDFEELWRTTLRPGDRRSAFILPENTFTTDKSLKDLWMRSQQVHRESTDDVHSIKKLSNQFLAKHYHRGNWIDDRDLVFSVAVDPHGMAPLQRQWKFTFKLEPGFHYDVSHTRSKQFTIVDSDRIRHGFDEYTNVDAHGVTRGGK